MSEWTLEEQKQHREEWCERLESGEYNQTTGALYDGDGYCCLGIACNLFIEKTQAGEWTAECTFKMKPGQESFRRTYSCLLPGAVREYFGLQTDVGEFIPPPGMSMPATFQEGDMDLAVLNDRGWDFGKIAKLIRLEPEGLVKTVE